MVRRLPSDTARNIAAQLCTEKAQSLFDKSSVPGSEIIKAQESLAKEVQDESVQREIQNITAQTKEALQGSILSKLDQGVGGQYRKNKTIHINQDQIDFTSKQPKKNPTGIIQATCDQINHIYQHEKQHAHQNDHLPIKFIGTDPVVALGRHILSIRDIIEGLNMSITGTHSKSGHQVVSQEYQDIHKRFQKALSSTQFSLLEVEKAVQSRDLTKIDSRAQDL